ncbi:MAG TPA: TadE/TadG family type IV pilus assembly protein [Thermomicrobiales bacterium]|nr:TadE/TadG family type IV pilus assembly protein [Thermomicrobiales bacterium]
MSDGAARGRGLPGQGVVEFAFVSIVLLLLIVGIVDLGRAVYLRVTFTNAMREGARYGMVNAAQAVSDPGDFQAGIVNAASSRSPILGISATTIPASGITCAPTAPNNPYFSTTFSTAYCSQGNNYPTTGDSLKVCGTYQITLIASRMLPIGPINITECSQALFQ